MTSSMRHGRAGFTMVDLLVSIAVMAVLIGILLPSLRAAQESARRVNCASNMRQIGYAMQMYATDNHGVLPRSMFYGSAAGDMTLLAQQRMPQQTMSLRVGLAQDRGSPQSSPESQAYVWDGLGLLFKYDYLSHYGVFYCPSHHGGHSYSDYLDEYQQMTGEISGNYQYRPIIGSIIALPNMPPSGTLLADGIRTQADFNHVVGANVFRADLSVNWFADQDGAFLRSLPVDDTDPSASAESIEDAWAVLDSAAPVGTGRQTTLFARRPTTTGGGGGVDGPVTAGEQHTQPMSMGSAGN